MTNKCIPVVSINYLSKLRTELENAASGLDHISEMDCPYQFFTLPAGNRLSETGLTTLEFLRRIGLSEVFIVNELEMSIDQFIEVRKFEEFFPTIEELAERDGTDTNDPNAASMSKRYRKLEEIFKKYLHDLKVFRIGKVEIQCFITG